MKYKAVKGMDDILPKDISTWQELERTARRKLESYGYSEIRTPILEDASVFIRSIGEETDIVTKEMYVFKDRKERPLAMRPEGTAPIVRSYVEHSFDKVSPQAKLYYIGPMFRSEKPQKGRSRQFHQIGVEVFGTYSPYADSEIIIQMDDMLKSFGLKEFIIKINSLGSIEDKKKFSNNLKTYLKEKESRLCDDCKNRIKSNPLRVFDCKMESCKVALKGSPNITDSLSEESKKHYEKVKNILDKMKIKYKEEKSLVRGLDYYTGTVFEVVHPALGAQDAIGAGGRYDNLVKDFGGKESGAVGYALGIERMILALKDKVLKTKPIIFIATLGDEAKILGIKISSEIRDKISIVTVLNDLQETSLKSQMRNADKNNADFVLIIGDDELKENKVTLRDMKTKEQCSVSIKSIAEEIKQKVG
jgi:histidyl-tRNA synthetase